MRRNNLFLGNLVIPASFAECLTYEQQVLWLNKRISELSVQVEDMAGQIDDLDPEKVQQMIQEVQITLQTYETIIQDIEKRQDAADQKVDGFASDISTMKYSISGIQSSILQINNQISGFEGRLSAQETKTGQLDTQVSGLEGRVAAQETKTGEIDGKVDTLEQEVQALQLTTMELNEDKMDKMEVDDAPTQNSDNLVTSGGVYEALQNIPGGGGTIVLDDTVTEQSSNGVKSSGIYQAIANVRTGLGSNIQNLEEKNTQLTEKVYQIENQQNVQQGDIENALGDIAALEADKQDQLKYYSGDSGNMEPITANVLQDNLDNYAGNSARGVIPSIYAVQEGIRKAISGGGGTGDLDNEVTETSQNGVTSEGIWQYGEGIKNELQEQITQNSTDASQKYNEYDQKLEEIEQQVETTSGQVSGFASDLQDKQDRLYTDNGTRTYANSAMASNLDYDPNPSDDMPPSVPTSKAVYNALQKKQGTITYYNDVASENLPVNNVIQNFGINFATTPLDSELSAGSKVQMKNVLTSQYNEFLSLLSFWNTYMNGLTFKKITQAQYDELGEGRPDNIVYLIVEE